MQTDIRNIQDIKSFVNAFYAKVREDDLIGPVFNTQVQDWDSHLPKMYRFWNMVLFAEPGYNGHPFAKHASLDISGPHFERWLALFHATIDELFVGEKAQEAKMRAKFMASMFQQKLEYIRKSDFRPLV